MNKYFAKPGVTCRKCRFFDKALCGYIALDGTKDRQGNTISINFDMVHNCSDFRRPINKKEIQDA